MKLRLPVALLVCGLIDSAAPCQDPVKLIDTFQKDVQKGRLPAVTDDVQLKFLERTKEINENLQVLAEISAKNHKLPESYLASLKSNNEAWKRATNPEVELNTNQRLAIVAAVECDLSTKRKFASKNTNAPAESISVTAYTPTENNKMAGYTVLWKVKADADNPNKKGTALGNPTNNATGPLSAGCYVMWVVDGNQKEGMRKAVQVGDSGDGKQIVELPIPN